MPGGLLFPCSVDDVAHLLGLIPGSDWTGLRTFIFKQPTRKQAILNPAWGKLRYHADVRSASGAPVASGAVVYLDAVADSLRIRWSRSLDPQDQAELGRLRADGHLVEWDGNHFDVTATRASARNTQLYRTLLHEIGHWFDWLEKVETPSQRGQDFGQLFDEYFARPTAEREAYAHRYGCLMHERLNAGGSIPFGPL